VIEVAGEQKSGVLLGSQFFLTGRGFLARRDTRRALSLPWE
jgi:hypothetical protein